MIIASFYQSLEGEEFFGSRERGGREVPERDALSIGIAFVGEQFQIERSCQKRVTLVNRVSGEDRAIQESDERSF